MGYTKTEQLQIALREFIAATPECDDSPDCRLCLAEQLQHFLDHPSAGDGEQG